MTRGRTVTHLERKKFHISVTFGEHRGTEPAVDAMLAADPHSMRLIPVDALEMTSGEM